MKQILKSTLATAALIAGTVTVNAGDKTVEGKTTAAVDTRYGLFNGLDHRSTYGTGPFPEPFLNDDTNLEENELRLDWFRGFKRNNHADDFKVEYEKSIGNLTLEFELHYERERADGATTEGWGNANVAARYPLYQWVSSDNNFDTTFGVSTEVGIPTNTVFSQSWEVVPAVFNDTRVGKHFTMQNFVGYSMIFDGEEDGIHTLEYGTTIGWAFSHEELPIPGVQQFIPVFEVSGEHQVNKEDAGVNNIVGLIGFRANLNPIGGVQPRLGLGYVFPLNNVAREDQNWGLYTSLVFEF